MRVLIAIVLFSIGTFAEACFKPVQTEMALESFPDEVAAVREMSRRFLASSLHEDVEYFGAVLKENQGQYRATFGQGCRGIDQINFSVGLKAGEELSAFWHTHGREGLARELFSADDASTVLSHQIPFYLIDPEGLIRVLDPHNATRKFATARVRESGNRVRLGKKAYPGQLVFDGEDEINR